jgi:hypothetical protein
MANKRGAGKLPELNFEAQAANAAAEAGRKQEKEARRKNAEKQKRFRDSMKEAGYKRVTLWASPYPAGVTDRMNEAGFQQVPAWEDEKTKPGETGREKRRGDSGKVKIALTIRESSLRAAERFPEVRQALDRAIARFLTTLQKDGDLTREQREIYRDFTGLLKPLMNPGEEW